MAAGVTATAGKGAAAARTANGSTAAKASKGSKGSKGSTKSGKADKSGPATQTDRRQLKREVAAGDMSEQAYEAGLDGTEWDLLTNEIQDSPGGREAYEAGLEERRGQSRSRAVSGTRDAASKVAGVKGPGWVNDGAGFVLGLVLFALVRNYLEGGPDQAKGWIAAKFINKPLKKRGGG